MQATSSQLDLQDSLELFAYNKEHRGWMVVVGVKRVRDRYYTDIVVRSPGALSGTCIPDDGVYVSESTARDAGVGIGCRWIDCHGISD